MTPRQSPPAASSAIGTYPDVHRPIATYARYDAMIQLDHWDAVPRNLVLDRVASVPSIRFFDEDEADLLAAVVDRVMPQDDRPPEDRIPVVPWIDNSLFNHISNGYRFDDMPPQEEAWRLGLQGIDETSRIRHGRGFLDLSADEQDEVLVAVATGKAEGDIWTKVPAKRFWDALLMSQICEHYYSHPTAWTGHRINL